MEKISINKKMKLTRKALGTRIIAGSLALLTVAALTTKASSVKLKDETLEITQGVDIFHDNKYLVPINENGEEIESFIYEDETYIPAETMAEMFGHSISWNERRKTLCIDKTEPIETNETYSYEEVSDKESNTLEVDVKTGIRLYVKDESGEERIIPKDEEDKELPIILFNDVKYLPISIVSDLFEKEVTWNDKFEGINIGVYDEEIALKGTNFIIEETKEPVIPEKPVEPVIPEKPKEEIVTPEPPKEEIQEPIVEPDKEELENNPEIKEEPQDNPIESPKEEPIVPEQPKEEIKEPVVEQPKEEPKVEPPKEEPKEPEQPEKPVEVVPPKEEVVTPEPPKQEPVVEQPKEEPKIEEPVKVDKPKPSNVDATVWKYYQDYLYCLDYLEPYASLLTERVIAYNCMTAEVGTECEMLNLDLSDPVLKEYYSEYMKLRKEVTTLTTTLRLANVEGNRQMHQTLFQRIESGTYTTFDRDVLKQTSELLLIQINELEQNLINTSPEAMENLRLRLVESVNKMAEYQKSKTLVLK